jgi:hypothetical protein
MLIAFVPPLIALIGLLIWLLAGNPVAKEIGKILFFCGVLVSVLSTMGRTVRIF